jgi:hypothetical protein
MTKANIILTVILYDKPSFINKIKRLEKVLGPHVNSGFGLGRYDATWKFNNIKEAFEAEKVAKRIMGGSEYGETAVMEPDVEIY